jgi:uncharacterized protein YndB with AHSA1/START domain
VSGVKIHHATFVIERQFRTTPARTFRFWAERDLKERWNGCHPDWTVIDEAFDFRVGGAEAKRWRTVEGSEQSFTAHYLDIVAPDRIVYAFEMSFGGERVSASLATVAFRLSDGATEMTYTEQIAFFGSRDALDQRIAGTGAGFERLAELMAAGTQPTT